MTKTTQEIDAQDPLPESNFFWRRLYSYIATFSLWGLLVFVIHKIEEPSSLRLVAMYLSLLLWFTITYYMIAPSAEQITRIVQAARNIRSGLGGSHHSRVEYDECAPGDERHVRREDNYDSEDAAPRSRYHD